MARKTKKRQSRANSRMWQAEPDDAIRLAALRWFALSIERLAIEIYASDKTQYGELEQVLRRALKHMGNLVTRDVGEEDEDSCPIGYELCRDGLCAPMCDGEVLDN